MKSLMHAGQPSGTFRALLTLGNSSKLLSICGHADIIFNMKTIAISIDEQTLAGLDALAAGPQKTRSRSSVVRLAVREYVERERQRAIEAGDAVVLRRHRGRLAKDARALVAVQARP